MNKLLSLILPFATLALSATSIKANDVETNITFALKLHYNPTSDYTETSSAYVRTHKTLAIKNADIIAAFNKANEGVTDFPFSSRAKIIRIQTFTGESVTVKYVLRDKDKQADVTSSFDWDSAAVVGTSKFSKKTTLGVAKDVRIDNFDLTMGSGENEFYIEGKNIGIYTYKDVFVKGTQDKVHLPTINQKIAGIAFLNTADLKPGIVEGTIKLGGAKVIPAQAK